MARRRILWRLSWVALGLVGLLVAAALSSPLWLGPLAQHQATAALGRPVKIERLRLRPGSPMLLTAEHVLIGNPPGFPPDEEPFLRIARLTLQVEVGTYLSRREIIIPSVELDRPVARIISTADGRSNFAFALAPTAAMARPPRRSAPCASPGGKPGSRLQNTTLRSRSPS